MCVAGVRCCSSVLRSSLSVVPCVSSLLRVAAVVSCCLSFAGCGSLLSFGVGRCPVLFVIRVVC